MKWKKKLSDALIDELEKEWEAGNLSVKDLATKYRVDVTTVRLYMARRGKSRKNITPDKLPASVLRIIGRRYIRGEGLPLLAEEYKISHVQLKRICAEWGWAGYRKEFEEQSKNIIVKEFDKIVEEDVQADMTDATRRYYNLVSPLLSQVESALLQKPKDIQETTSLFNGISVAVNRIRELLGIPLPRFESSESIKRGRAKPLDVRKLGAPEETARPDDIIIGDGTEIPIKPQKTEGLPNGANGN